MEWSVGCGSVGRASRLQSSTINGLLPGSSTCRSVLRQDAKPQIAPDGSERVYEFLSKLGLRREATFPLASEWVNADLCCKSALSS